MYLYQRIDRIQREVVKQTRMDWQIKTKSLTDNIAAEGHIAIKINNTF